MFSELFPRNIIDKYIGQQINYSDSGTYIRLNNYSVGISRALGNCRAVVPDLHENSGSVYRRGPRDRRTMFVAGVLVVGGEDT